MQAATEASVSIDKLLDDDNAVIADYAGQILTAISRSLFGAVSEARES